MRTTKRRSRRTIKEAFAATAAEEAAKVNRDLGDTPGEPGSLSEDPAYWEKYGIVTGEDLAIDLVASTYSDMHKAIHNRRPRENFNSFEEVQSALADLERYYAGMAEREELETAAADAYERERAELAAMMPTALELQYDKFPERAGMGRRSEGRIRISGASLRKVIRETLLASRVSRYGRW